MRWSIIRLIWLRELRDQLRDRRTILMVAVLPVLLYPLLGLGVLQIAEGLGGKPSVVGVYGAEHLPAEAGPGPGRDPAAAAAWLSLTPPAPAGGVGSVARVSGAAALAHVADLCRGQDYPPLLRRQDDKLRFAPVYLDALDEVRPPDVRALSWTAGVPAVPEPGEDDKHWLKRLDRGPLERREVDVLLIVPGDFAARLAKGQRLDLGIRSRPGDDNSRLATKGVQGVLERWNGRLAQVRLLRHGLPANYGEAFTVRDPDVDRDALKQTAERLIEALVRVFPFLLVMWSLTGALYPAVDLCAGEKERGTMETLLISPASREEIVYGKFLTIWVFSGSTALLNLLSMGLTTVAFSGQLPVTLVRPAAVAWCVLLVLPLSAFFSAVCLAVGAYARSTKEGQYYLMPLFLITMPLIFLTLAPGVELNAFYAMVPVTGVALLLQRLLMASTLDKVPWLYFGPVLAPTVLYGWLALRWAVSQFQREEVLFREAERLDVRLWLRRLFREKEPLPSAGQALFCFGVIVGLHWLSAGPGTRLHLQVHAAIDLVAFVVAPPLLMALLLTTRPRYGLGLRLPPAQALISAAGLVLLLVLPLADLSSYLLASFPDLKKLLTETTPLAALMEAVQRGQGEPGSAWQLPLVLVLLAPVCEELAFRGFILTGLRQRFHPGTAILLSSLLFAVSHLNVFQFLPTFILGVLLGLVATRSRSVLPGILVHVLYNGLFVAPVVFPEFAEVLSRALASPPLLRPALVAGCSALVAFYLAVTGYRLWATGRSPWWDEIASPQPPSRPPESANGAAAPGRPADRGAVS
jgi:sodium transport system permease protein